VLNSVCEELQASSFGADLFQQGDSVFEKGYKYLEIRDFCQTSDRMMAHMIYNYFEGE
jgi:hypothetical protein